MADKQLVQRDPDPLFEALGTAMSQWQAIESTLFDAFHNILGVDQKYSAYLYFSVRSPERKVKLVDDLFKLYLGGEGYKKKAKAIFKRMYDLTDERNNIAHFCIQVAKKRKAIATLSFPKQCIFHICIPILKRRKNLNTARMTFSLSDANS